MLEFPFASFSCSLSSWIQARAYHKQSLEYIKSILDASEDHKNIDPIDQKSIDPKLNSNGLESENKLGRSSSLVRIDFDGEVSRNSLFF
jgi:hypothetical protein